MDLGDLLQAAVAVVIVLMGLLGGKKKKPSGQQSPVARRPDRPIPVRRPAPAAGGDRLLLELERRLEAARLPEANSLEDVSRAEAESVETLEPAGGASHDRFHERYLRPLDEIRRVEVHATLAPGGIRAAVVWSEILGPPKGLRS